MAATHFHLTPYELPETPDVENLVIDDEAPVGILREKQQRLLTEPLYSSWSGPPPLDDGEARRFAALANVGLFAMEGEQPVVPDVMLSLDVAIADDLRLKKNRSYFMWTFGKPPDVVIELVSNREGGELGSKIERYQRIGVSHYVVYDPLAQLGGQALRSFELRGGVYVSTLRPWFESVGLGLMVWEGEFEGTQERWLRWCTRDGQLLPTGAERAAAAETREAAEKARAERLAEKLRALGIDPADA